jgi:hypothetical protein
MLEASLITINDEFIDLSSLRRIKEFPVGLWNKSTTTNDFLEANDVQKNTCDV